jgi:hypothetical protein
VFGIVAARDDVKEEATRNSAPLASRRRADRQWRTLGEKSQKFEPGLAIDGKRPTKITQTFGAGARTCKDRLIERLQITDVKQRQGRIICIEEARRREFGDQQGRAGPLSRCKSRPSEQVGEFWRAKIRRVRGGHRGGAISVDARVNQILLNY